MFDKAAVASIILLSLQLNSTNGFSVPSASLINKNVHKAPSAFLSNAQSSTSCTRYCPSSSSSLASSSSATEVLPGVDEHGIYDIQSKEEHIALLNANPDKIIILKFFAPWCRACKGLEPKYIQISKDPKYEGLPLVFAQLSVAHNKDYIKSLGVLALPSVHIYSGAEGLVENFPCGPSKVPILKKKIAQVVNQKVDPATYKLKPVESCVDSEAEPCTARNVTGAGTETQLSVGDVVVSEETMDHLRNGIPFFKDLTEEEFSGLMAKSKYVTFDEGSVIMREGMPGRTFYVIDSGEVEILVKGAFEDPLTTPSGYLGTSINRLLTKDYFGERSLITGQPRAATVRTVTKTRCFSFDVDDIPSSSVLSGKKVASSERMANVNHKYGVDYYDINLIDSQFKQANVANQARGSVNNPQILIGVDTDDEIVTSTDEDSTPNVKYNDNILSLLVRFKLLRHAGRCFDYIQKTNPKWGDKGEAYRRSLLVSKLTSAQRSEFTDVFKLIDTSADGKISLMELKQVLETIDDSKTDEEVRDIINKSDPSIDGNTEIPFTEFMGVMAEAEFYYLFKETFATLDKENTGYVTAGRIDAVLSGLRDLISDDRNSLIDVDDKDMLIDYETFSRMMIGAV